MVPFLPIPKTQLCTVKRLTTLTRMAKQYGLILPGQQKTVTPIQRDATKPSIFDESSASDDSEDGPPLMQMKKAPLGPSVMERRRARNLQEKALAEDPTIFQYDELYDGMENKREEEKQVKSLEPKKPKYITKLLETAERRKLENELRVERQVQKEREAEGEQFKDKEAFVTSSYRKKLEEMRKLEEQNRRDDYLEAIGDVTKQQDLDGFYRHLYEQKMGTAKEVKKPELQSLSTTPEGIEEQIISYRPIKSGKPTHQRPYRKRQSSVEEDSTEKKRHISLTDTTDKKQHLTNNIDADSDFSIDDSSSESSSSEEQEEKTNKKASVKNASTKDADSATVSIVPNLDALKKEQNFLPDSMDISKPNKTSKSDHKLSSSLAVDDAYVNSPPTPKRDKMEIWKKRTVGETFQAAVQRFYERKAARYQA